MYEIIEINGKKYAKGLAGYYEVDEQGRIRFDKGPVSLPTPISNNKKNEGENKNTTSLSSNTDTEWGYTSITGETVTFSIPSGSSSSSSSSLQKSSQTSSYSSSSKSSLSRYEPPSLQETISSDRYIGMSTSSGYKVIDTKTGQVYRYDTSGKPKTEQEQKIVFISFSDSLHKKYKPIGGMTTITGEEITIYEEMGRKPKEIVDKYLSSDWKEAVITSIPVVGQIWHAYETWQATKELEEYLKQHPEEARHVYEQLGRLRKEKLKQLAGDTVMHTAMILVPAIAVGRVGVIAGKIAGSPLTKTALQGALIGATVGATGETGRQLVNVAFGDKFNTKQVLLATGVGAGLGALLGAGLYKIATKTGRYHLVSDESVVKDVNIENIKIKRFGNQIIYSGSGKANIEYYVHTRKGSQLIGVRQEPYHFSGRSYVIKSQQIFNDVIQNADDNVLEVLRQVRGVKSSIKTEGTGYIGKQRFEAEFYGYEKAYQLPKYSQRQLDAIKKYEELLGELHPKFKETPESFKLLQNVKNTYSNVEKYAQAEEEFIRRLVSNNKDFAVQIVGYGGHIKTSGLSYGRYIGRITSGRNAYYTTLQDVGFRVGDNEIIFIKGLQNKGREFVGKIATYGRSGLRYGQAYYRDPTLLLEDIQKILPKGRFVYVEEPKPIFPSPIVNKITNNIVSSIIGISTAMGTNLIVQSSNTSQTLVTNIIQSVKNMFGKQRQRQRYDNRQESTIRPRHENTIQEQQQTEGTSTYTYEQTYQTTVTTEETTITQITPEPQPQEKPQENVIPPPLPYTPPTVPPLPYPPFIGLAGSFAGSGKQLQQSVNKLVNEIVYSVRRLF